MNFGWVVKLDTGNLGDEIQSIAARRFLPSIDKVIDRERPDLPLNTSPDPIKAILNGWWMHRPEFWPPSPAIMPLITSFHITRNISGKNFMRIPPSEVLLSDRNLIYLHQHSPIGARDIATYEMLKAKGVDVFFSGCLTLTLNLFQDVRREEYVCLVDLSDEVRQAFAGRIKSPVHVRTHWDVTTTAMSARVAQAEALLREYAAAKCVVTSRLHCALPSLALGTPVLLVLEAADTYRFSGLRELVHNCTREQAISGTGLFDPDVPPPNFPDYLGLRENLIRQCQRFCGTGGTGSVGEFYALPAAERIAVTKRVAVHGADLSTHWNSIEPEIAARWEFRAALAAEWLSGASVVADLGCGTMQLERGLRADQKYLPVDFVQRDDRTIVLDLNVAKFDELNADYCALLGVIEYIMDVPFLLNRIARRFPRVVASYVCRMDAQTEEWRLGLGWVNHFTYVDLRRAFAAAGFVIEREQQITANGQYLFLLVSTNHSH